jgi:predicted transposase YdaD
MRSATEVLMGLRWPDELIRHIFEGVGAMRESVVYQRILSEGRAEGRAEERAEGLARVRRSLLLLGSQRFGEPSEAVHAALTAITDVDRLERMTAQVLRVGSWEELLAVS